MTWTRRIVISVASCLGSAFLVRLGLHLHELSTWPEPATGFIVDAAPQYPLGGYHLLSVLLFPFVILIGRSFVPLALYGNYLLLHLYATRERLCAGFLGGELCPDVPFSMFAMSRATWFDWASTLLLFVIVFLLMVETVWLRLKT